MSSITCMTCRILLRLHSLQAITRSSITCSHGAAPAQGADMSSLDAVLKTHQQVIEEGFTKPGGLKYRSYAVSTLRGGVGKSTLAFNLAYELASSRSLLIGDLCPQCNLTETL